MKKMFAAMAAGMAAGVAGSYLMFNGSKDNPLSKMLNKVSDTAKETASKMK